jgi:acyl-CoA synthetase (NDP forming)
MNEIECLLSQAAQEGRWALSEIEVYEVLDRLDLTTPKRFLAAIKDIPLPADVLQDRLASLPGEKVVLKVSSHKTLHKTESGGVKVCAKAEAAARLSEMKSKFPDADGILLSEFVPHAVFSLGQELMLGARADKAFGPILTLGIGGTDAEGLTSALKPGFSPAIAATKLAAGGGSWQHFLDRAWIWRYVSGNVRGGKRLAEDAAMLQWLDGFQRLLDRFCDGGSSPWTIEEVEVNPLAVSDERIVALDGVLRFRKSQAGTRDFPSSKAVWSLLRPATVAVAGVSEKKMNMGRIILNNVLEAGFDKSRLFVLKDYPGEIDGAKCYKSPADFPEPVDMFVVAVPSPEVPGLLRQSAESGKVRGVSLISGGMGEKAGSEKVKDEVLAVIAEGRRKNPDFAVSGGNSMGIVSVPAKVNTFFIPKKKLVIGAAENAAHARTAFISQSGAFVISMVSKMEWLKPAYCVTVGNQMDVTVCDYVEQVVEDDTVKVILVYLEGLKEEDGLKLAHSVARARASGQTVIVYKAGRTPTGTKAVMGHTASIAGDFVVMRAILSCAGAWVAEDFDQFEDLTQMACFCHGRGHGGPHPAARTRQRRHPGRSAGQEAGRHPQEVQARFHRGRAQPSRRHTHGAGRALDRSHGCGPGLASGGLSLGGRHPPDAGHEDPAGRGAGGLLPGEAGGTGPGLGQAGRLQRSLRLALRAVRGRGASTRPAGVPVRGPGAAGHGRLLQTVADTRSETSYLRPKGQEHDQNPAAHHALRLEGPRGPSSQSAGPASAPALRRRPPARAAPLRRGRRRLFRLFQAPGHR